MHWRWRRHGHGFGVDLIQQQGPTIVQIGLHGHHIAVRLGQNLHQAWGAIEADGVFTTLKRHLQLTSAVHFFLARQMADKEVFGLRQQVGVDGGGRLGCIGNADVKLRPLFGKAGIHMGHGSVLQRKDGVCLFKINLHITPLQSIQFELVFLR